MENINGKHVNRHPYFADGYVLIVGKPHAAGSVQQLLWENGILSYVPKPRLPIEMIVLRRGNPKLLLAFVDDLETDVFIQTEELRLHEDIPLMCIVSSRLHEPRVLAMLHLATDFIRAPVDQAELLLRIQRLDRVQTDSPPQHRSGAASRTTTLGSGRSRSPKQLSPIELQILSLLEQNLGDTVNFETLSQCVDGETLDQRINTLRVHVLRLRRKLEPNPKQPEYILNERAVGYRLAKPINAELLQ